MINTFFSAAGPLIGACLAAALLLLLAIPLLMGLMMAFNYLRYREWLAILAFAASMATLVESADFLYNLIYWTSSRLSPGMNFTLCVLILGAPPFLFILIFTRSRRRVLWGLGMLLLTALALVSMRDEFAERKARDAETYRQGMRPLSPRTGTSFVRWWRDYRGQVERVLLQGHVPEATEVVLLTDPFSRSFQPQFCTGAASTYRPPV